MCLPRTPFIHNNFIVAITKYILGNGKKNAPDRVGGTSRRFGREDFG